MKVRITVDLQVNRVIGGGWTENFVIETGYSDRVGSLQAARTWIGQYLTLRMQLATPDMICIGAKVTFLQLIGSRPVPIVFTNSPFVGTSGTLNETAAFLALELSAVSQQGNRRTIRFAGLGSNAAAGGQVTLSSSQQNALTPLIGMLVATFIDCIDVTQPLFPIASISPTGVVTTVGNTPFASGSQVQLFRVTSPTGQRLGGVKLVGIVTAANQFSIGPWTETSWVYDSGSVRQYVETFNPIFAIAVQRIVARKIGRPLGLSRARRFARRTR
jgi:hypothetical protein